MNPTGRGYAPPVMEERRLMKSSKQKRKEGAMAGRRKQPIALLEYKGKARKTKAEIEKRKKEEIQANPASGVAPNYLDREQKALYKKYAKALLSLNIFADIDEWTLAAFVKSYFQWRRILGLLEEFCLDVKDEESMKTYKNLCIEQNRWFSQCRSLASDMGLNVTSRCKLVAPEKEEKPENKFESFLA